MIYRGVFMSNFLLNQNFRDLLKNELIQRINKNKKYSLRAFAKNIEIDPSLLSKILREQRPISIKLIEKIGPKLNLNPQEIDWFRQLELVAQKSKNSIQFNPIEQDHFEIISDWFHFAILELMNVHDFRNDFNWISKRLGIPVYEFKSAVDRLHRVGLLKVNSNGDWEDCSNNHRTFNLGPEYTSGAHRYAQKQILELSLMALEQIPIQERDHSSIMMATNLKKLNTAKMMIDKFRHDLCKFLETTDKKERIYQLSVSLFPISK
jgi:uncharacterized protein (TIGR02147 family)